MLSKGESQRRKYYPEKRSDRNDLLGFDRGADHVHVLACARVSVLWADRETARQPNVGAEILSGVVPKSGRPNLAQYGSIFLFMVGAALYALVVAALGILLGTLSTTMGQFGLLAMPVLIVTQLLSGSSTPMESMPVWLQYVMKTISPTPHFVSFAQAVLFRGADLSLVWRPLVAMLIIGSVYFFVALSRFRRVIFGS